MTELPTGTLTLLFTDVEGSTGLLQRLGESYRAALEAHRHLLRAAFEAHGGREVDTQGDSFFVVFPRAADAVAAAVAAQRALAEYPWPEGVAVRVRMGLHTGEPSLGPGGYVGLDVHRAARLGAAGHGGQVLLSEATRVLVERELPEGASPRDLGEHRLKDLLRVTSLVDGFVGEEIEGITARRPVRARGDPARRQVMRPTRDSGASWLGTHEFRGLRRGRHL